MILFGIAALLPWNAVLTSLDFFESKMPEYHPSSVFGFAVNGLLVFTSIWNMVYGHKYSFVSRISGGYIIIAVLMIVLPLVTNALHSGQAFAADIGILTIFGVVGGIVQSSTFALGGILPGKYMGAIMFGNGISGITLNVCRAICLIAIPDDIYLGSLIYFVLAALILVVCAIGQWKFQTLEFVKYYIKLANDEKNRSQRRISGVSNALLDEDA
jgi:solute carrier family 29 (equilibrative nucleoside transporter), member 1/2/3